MKKIYISKHITNINNSKVTKQKYLAPKIIFIHPLLIIISIYIYIYIIWVCNNNVVHLNCHHHHHHHGQRNISTTTIITIWCRHKPFLFIRRFVCVCIIKKKTTTSFNITTIITDTDTNHHNCWNNYKLN